MNTMLKKAGVDENEIKDSELPTQVRIKLFNFVSPLNQFVKYDTLKLYLMI